MKVYKTDEELMPPMATPGDVAFTIKEAKDIQKINRDGVNYDAIELKLEVKDKHGTVCVINDWLGANAPWRVKELLFSIGRSDLWHPDVDIVARHFIATTGRCRTALKEGKSQDGEKRLYLNVVKYLPKSQEKIDGAFFDSNVPDLTPADLDGNPF